MTTKDITIEIKQGTETSPVAKCVQVASQFESKIYVEYETKKVNAKSIMGMMALQSHQPGKGTNLTLIAEGDDEEQAVSGVESFLLAQ